MKDANRKGDFNDEIAAEKENKGFMPSTDDLDDIFTIGKS
jgi:hypothetical protein